MSKGPPEVAPRFDVRAFYAEVGGYDGIHRPLDAAVGVKPTAYTFETDDQFGEVMVVSEGEWTETSLVPFPAFTNARVSDVAAAAPVSTTTPNEESAVDDTTATTVAAEQEAPAVVAAAPRTSGEASASKLSICAMSEISPLLPAAISTLFIAGLRSIIGRLSKVIGRQPHHSS